MIRALDDPAAREVLGTEKARYPFLSHDGRWIGFFVGQEMRKVPTTGGNPIEILHAMGAKKDAPKALDQRFDRVLTGYQLNESLMKNRSRRVVKDVINGMLNVSRLGDSLKVFAIR